MGCDIHCYIEYKERDRWRDFGGRINPGRNYTMFEALAGVRGNEKKAVVPPRGFPEDAACEARSDNRLFVVDHETDDEDMVSREKADRWVASGSSEYTADRQFVSHPDWHTHSWVNAEELDQAIAGKVSSVEYHAISAVLKFFNARGYDSRLVFWFDN